MFFVGTAPLGAAAHVNIAPKGLDTLRILDAIMLCAFQGPPKNVRLHGRGEVLEPHRVSIDGLPALAWTRSAGSEP